MHAAILNHTPQVGRRTKADNAHWDLIGNIWRDKTPRTEPPANRDRLTKINRAHGPAMDIIHYDERQVFVSFWIDGKEHWYEYQPPNGD